MEKLELLELVEKALKKDGTHNEFLEKRRVVELVNCQQYGASNEVVQNILQEDEFKTLDIYQGYELSCQQAIVVLTREELVRVKKIYFDNEESWDSDYTIGDYIGSPMGTSKSELQKLMPLATNPSNACIKEFDEDYPDDEDLYSFDEFIKLFEGDIFFKNLKYDQHELTAFVVCPDHKEANGNLKIEYDII